MDVHRKGQFHRHGGKEEIKADVADDRRRRIVMRWRSVFLFGPTFGGQFCDGVRGRSFVFKFVSTFSLVSD